MITGWIVNQLKELSILIIDKSYYVTLYPSMACMLLYIGGIKKCAKIITFLILVFLILQSIKGSIC